jgi:hypothetical protein
MRSTTRDASSSGGGPDVPDDEDSRLLDVPSAALAGGGDAATMPPYKPLGDADDPSSSVADVGRGARDVGAGEPRLTVKGLDSGWRAPGTGDAGGAAAPAAP